MVVVIRLKRTGRRNRPCYRITVADSRMPRDGRTLENLGLYDPISRVPEARVKLRAERIRHWLKNGAQPSPTVYSLLKREGALEAAPPRMPRDRSGRKKTTAKKSRRVADQETRAEQKQARHSARVQAKRAAKKAAAAGAESAG